MSDWGKLTFFRGMAFVVGVALLVLTVHMVLRYGFGNDVLGWWAMPHGFLYMVYLVSVFLLGFELRWGMGRMVLVMLAGTVPFVSFWVEHRVTEQARRQLEARHAAGGGTGAVAAAGRLPG